MCAEREVLNWTNRVVSLPCWSVVAGSIGSCFSMRFGDKLPRTKPLNNPNLTYDERHFSGEYGLLVSGSSWFLFCGGRKVVDWTEDGSFDGPIESGLRQLRDKYVSAATLDLTSGDLEMLFDPGAYVLKVSGEDLSSDENGYCLFFPDRTVSRRCNGNYEIQIDS